MGIRWEVRPLEGGGWQGSVEWDMPGRPASERTVVTHRASSPGEAIEGAVCGAYDLCGVLDESGIDLGDIFTTVLDTASNVVRSVGGRSRRGSSPGPEETRLPSDLSSLARVAAMRPGAPGYGYGPPPGYGYPPPPMPGYGAPPGYGYGKPAGGIPY